MAAKEKKKAVKEYFPPKIVHTEKLEARAVTCAMANDAQCIPPGPIQS
jgi:hypothetical protein